MCYCLNIVLGLRACMRTLQSQCIACQPFAWILSFTLLSFTCLINPVQLFPTFLHDFPPLPFLTFPFLPGKKPSEFSQLITAKLSQAVGLPSMDDPIMCCSPSCRCLPHFVSPHCLKLFFPRFSYSSTCYEDPFMLDLAKFWSNINEGATQAGCPDLGRIWAII